MASIVPDEEKIQSFRTEAAFERWLSKNHDRETEEWLRIFKRDSGVATVAMLERGETIVPERRRRTR